MEKLGIHLVGIAATSLLLFALTALHFDTILLAAAFAALVYNGTVCLKRSY
jgi:hypothetical protein